MAPRTGGNPMEGLDKVETNSEDFQYLIQCHKDGTFSQNGYKPADFYHMSPDFSSQYTLKAVQTAWANAKRQAGGKAALVAKGSNAVLGKYSGNTLVSPPLMDACNTSALIDQGLAKIQKLDDASCFVEKAVACDTMASHWHPLMLMWTWKKENGHSMITIEFNPTAGMSPGTTEGIDIYACGASCTITADWPKEFFDAAYTRKYYSEQELDVDTHRMLNAKVDILKSIVKRHGDTPRATVVIPLPFHVIETREPEMKTVNVEKSGAYMVTIRLASTFVPDHTAKKIHTVPKFAD